MAPWKTTSKKTLHFAEVLSSRDMVYYYISGDAMEVVFTETIHAIIYAGQQLGVNTLIKKRGREGCGFKTV